MTEAQNTVLRIATAGSVDDGKSTLIGRLLYESHAILDDQLEALQKGNGKNGVLDLSLVTDGLKSEREQGITIDVAYKYFSSNRRKFILADAPGHVQYTRNMVTAASRADAAIILIDARYGVQEQTRRHAYLVHLLGVQHIVLAINKIDLISYDQARIHAIENEFRALRWNRNHKALHVIPLSALKGDNISEPSVETPWYQGKPLLALLESLPVIKNEGDAPQLPVQLVVRNNSGKRFASGTLNGGSLKVGDAVRILPSNQLSVVADILRAGESARHGAHGDAVAIRLEDERDLERGSLIVKAETQPRATQNFSADLVWFDEENFQPEERYILCLGTQTSRATVEELSHRFDLKTLEAVKVETVAKNDIVSVKIRSSLPLYLQTFANNKFAGSFILIDPLSFRTVAAGMVEAIAAGDRNHRGRVEIVTTLAEKPSLDFNILQIPRAFLQANNSSVLIEFLKEYLQRGFVLQLEESVEARRLHEEFRANNAAPQALNEIAFNNEGIKP